MLETDGNIDIQAVCHIQETTLRAYSVPLRTLNVERLLFSPLRGLTVVRRSAVLNGILRGHSAYASPRCS